MTMGVAESSVLARDILANSERAENEGKSKLDDEALWRNHVLSPLSWIETMVNARLQDTLKAVEHICKYLPKDIRFSPDSLPLRRP